MRARAAAALSFLLSMLKILKNGKALSLRNWLLHKIATLPKIV
jgi:hypothetical protein